MEPWLYFFLLRERNIWEDKLGQSFVLKNLGELIELGDLGVKKNHYIRLG